MFEWGEGVVELRVYSGFTRRRVASIRSLYLYLSPSRLLPS